MVGLKQVNIYGELIEIACKSKSVQKPRNQKLKQKIDKLYALYENLFKKQDVNILELREVIVKDDILIYPEDRQAEPVCMIELTIEDIDKRIEIMSKFMEKYNDKVRNGT